MTRLFARAFALVALVLVPTAAHAQKEPPHTKETKNVEKFVGLALTRQDPAQKRAFLEQALPPLREAIAKDPENARVWLLAGHVYSGLGQFVAADSAFDAAVTKYPGYADQIETERHTAWEAAFNNAVGLLNSQKTDEGIRALEEAEMIYEHRPEAKFYLGLFAMQKNEIEKSERWLKASMESVKGPLRAKLQPAALEEWDKLANNAQIKLSNVLAFRGADLYDKQAYDSAAIVFARARELSRPSRDHLFNQLQSQYALALKLDEERKGKKDAALDKRAADLYTSIIALTDTLRTVDPRNEDIFFFSSRGYKVLSEVASDPAVKTKHLNSLRQINTEYEQLLFTINDIQIAEGDTSAVVKGNITNRLLKAGATGTLTFELLGMDGNVIGSAPVNFTVPAAAKDAKIAFEVTIPMSGPLAGWRYKVQ